MKLKEKNKFSMIARIKSANNAWRGISIFFKTTHNAWLQVFFAILATYLGFILQISNTEWLVIILTIGLVFITEAINTAIEIDINLTSPEFHPYARDTKDVAAGAVLIAVILSIIVAILVFLPKIINMLQ